MIQHSDITLQKASTKRAELKRRGETLVITNGCFDLLHSGHAYSLSQAAEMGNQLWVLMNSDSSVKKLKGESRPIICERDRAYLLRSLRSVNEVIIFSSETIEEEIIELKPDIYVKSSDYNLDSMNQYERAALEEVNAKISFVEILPNLSTTNILRHVINKPEK